MKINRTEFVNILNLIKPGLAAQELIEQSMSFVFNEGMIHTYNDEISISHPIVLDEINGAVSSKELFALLAKIKDDEIDVYVEDNELRIEGKRINSGIFMDADVVLPFLVPPEDAEWYDCPSNLIAGLAICQLSTAHESVSSVLSAVHVSEEFVESCDNYRITRYPLETTMSQSFLIPAKSAKALTGFQPNDYTIHDNWAHFDLESTGMRMSCRVFQEKFPDLEQLLIIENGTKLVIPEELADIVDRSSVFSSDGDGGSLINIILKNNWAEVKSQNEKGWFTEKIRTKSTPKKPINFMVNPQLLRDVLRLSNEAIISPSAILFEAEGFQHAIALIVEKK